MDNKQKNNKNLKKNGSLLSFILPYILILGIIVVVVMNFGGMFGSKAKVLDYKGNHQNMITEINTVDKEDMKEIVVSVRQEVIVVSGSFSRLEDGKKVEYTFKGVFDKTDAIRASLTTGFEKFGNKLSYNDAFYVSIWQQLFPTLLTLVVVGGIGFLMISKLGNSQNNKAFDFGKSPIKNIENSKVKFRDVAGCDEEKAEMAEVVDYLKHPKKFAEMGARVPKGIILTGNPGTGKTLLAKAVAGEAGVPFFSISGSDFVEMFVGVGASRVRDMFKKAQQFAPSIIFIDEIDAVGRQRGTGLGGGHDEREQTLNQLLVEMDGFADNSGVIIIAATNRPDVLDPALLRPGRFDRQIMVALPDKIGREAILKVHARNKKMDVGVNFANIAQRTPGFSGAELENVLNEAAILAVRQKKTTIDMKDIDEAIDRVIGGPAKTSKVITPEEKKLVAFHESGHAILGLKLANAMKVQKVTIIPRGQAGGYVLMTPTEEKFLSTKKELLDRIAGLLAGRVSEEIFFDDITDGASNDIEKATKIARVMVTELGMSSLGPIQFEKQSGSVFLGRDYTNSQRNFSSEVAFEIDKEVEKIMINAMETAREIITKYKAEVTLIAETLLQQETLTNEEVVSLVETGKLPVKVVEETVQPTTEQVIEPDKTKGA